MSRRTAIYHKPKLGGCEDEPIDGPIGIPISELPPPPPPPLPPRPIDIHQEPLIPCFDVAQSRPVPPTTLVDNLESFVLTGHFRIGVIEEQIEDHRPSIALQESDSEHEIEKSASSKNTDQDSDSFDTPESFDSGHPTSPTRDQQQEIDEENALEREFLKT